MTDPTLQLKTKMLGALIREARKREGKSLKHTAELIGISSSTLSSYELGRKGISLPELEQLAFHFDIPVDGFLNGQLGAAQPDSELDPKVVVSSRQKMIGGLIREHREEADMSIRSLSEKTGFPASRVSAYERGQRPIPVPELESLAAALDHPITDYIDTEGQGPVADWYRDRRAHDAFLALPEDTRELLGQEDSDELISLATRLGEISIHKLRELAQLLTDITR